MKKILNIIKKKIYKKYPTIINRIDFFSPFFSNSIHYYYATRQKLNLLNPKTINDKQQWLKIYLYRNNIKIRNCVDKYLVRDYVLKKGCGNILVSLYGVYDSTNDIIFSKLPKSFVLKCTHGSGYNIVVKDKNSINESSIKNQLNKWMNEIYGKDNLEYLYYNIVPRIICEQYIVPDDGNAPIDYKFFCSYGEVKFIYTMIGNDEIQDYYDSEWNWLPVKSANYPNNTIHLNKPKKFDQLIYYAKILSADFPFVRVDLYYENDTIYFGELTFLTTGGLTNYKPKKFNRVFGDLFPSIKQMKTIGIKED